MGRRREEAIAPRRRQSAAGAPVNARRRSQPQSAEETREVADYVRDDSHLETREEFALNGVSDWEGAAQISLQRAREVFAVLQRMPTEA